MKNGVNWVYIDLKQKENEDRKLLKEVNIDLENAIDEVIINYFYENIDLIIDELKTKPHIEEEKEKEKEKNNHLNNSITDNKIDESQEIHENNISDHLISHNKEDSKKQGIVSDNTYSTYKELLSNLDSFYPYCDPAFMFGKNS